MCNFIKGDISHLQNSSYKLAMKMYEHLKAKDRNILIKNLGWVYLTSWPKTLGTVLVEMRDEESRASIMKNKFRLQENSNPAFQNLMIRNMKSKEQMFMENLGNSILKKIPGCENSFVTSNGQVRDSSNRAPPAPYRASYNRTRAPLTNSNRVP